MSKIILLIIIFIILIGTIYILTREKKEEVQGETGSILEGKEKFMEEKKIKQEYSLKNESLVLPSQKKYHKESCRFANKNIKAVPIETAKLSGLKPCRVCNPE